MKAFIFACALLAVATAQDCANCGASAVRQDRVGCRLFCQLDVDGNGNATPSEFLDVWANVWGCPGTGCNEAQWTAAVQPVMQVCDNEASAAFNRLATVDSASDPLRVEDVDMLTWHERILLASGASICDYAAFNVWFNVFYLDIADPACTSGY